MTSKEIKELAASVGATVCGIGDIRYFVGDDPKHNPLSILPKAKCIIGIGMKIPRGLYSAMERGGQYYNYTNVGVQYIDENQAEIILFKMASKIEDEGYDACLQRSVPGFRVKGDKSMNPEVNRVFELQYATPVAEGKVEPDVLIDFNKAAVVCGLGSIGLHDKIITPKYGTFMRYAFIITDMPLTCDEPFAQELCDKCGKCMEACPGKAISANGLDTWQCSIYYRGAHRSNPFMKDDCLGDEPERDAILNGSKRFDAESASQIYDKLDFLPQTQYGYVPCLCGKKCEVICYKHLKEVGRI